MIATFSIHSLADVGALVDKVCDLVQSDTPIARHLAVTILDGVGRFTSRDVLGIVADIQAGTKDVTQIVADIRAKFAA